MNKSVQTSQFWQDLKSGHFASMVKETSKGRSISNSAEVYNIMKPLFAKEVDVEKVYFIFIDAKNKIVGIENLFSGTLTAASIYPREIVKRVIGLAACGFIMTHNHPSGSTTPSAEDKAITIRVGIAALSIGVAFHDHIIIGDGYHSMADTGWMKQISDRFASLSQPEIS